jgi:hypothetical protein
MQAEPWTAARSAAAGLYCRGELGPAVAGSAALAGLVRFDPKVGGTWLACRRYLALQEGLVLAGYSSAGGL